MRYFKYTPMIWAVLGLLFAAFVSAADFLDPEQAFQLKAERQDAHTVKLEWRIAPGYKLYREQFQFSSEKEKLGKPVFPAGERKYDENLGQEVETYHDRVAVILPLATAPESFDLNVRYQGCAEAGLCYPPITKTLSIAAAAPAAPTDSAAAAAEKPAVENAIQRTDAAPANEDDGAFAERTLKSGSLLRIGLVFLAFGLLLSLTPCVLPMVPILSSIIIGEDVQSKRRGFLLALSYSLGMAMVYTSLGVAAGLAGEGLAGALQKPWVLVTFAMLMVLLALSMFDIYQLQLPASLQTRLTLASDRQRGGRFAGVFVMGAISALIVGPCVAAPLAGALVYISQTRDVLIGGWALFFMAVGMSAPLLLTGLSAGALLPRAGAWMSEVKHAFGLVLIGVAIWMVHPVLPDWAVLLAWGAYAILCAVFLHAFEALPAKAGVGARFAKAAGLLFLVIGALELVGAASGGQDALQPLSHIRVSGNSGDAIEAGPAFTRIHSIVELERTLKASTAPVMLDFYADWCVACKEMERMTFRNAGVAQQLGKVVLLQADVTEGTPEERALMKRFNLYGPPGIIFFNPVGKEVPQSRVIGYLEPGAFLAHIKQHLADYLN
jgi:thiol:disulfide interchange protein DsbD